MAARIVAPWNLPPGWSAPTQKMYMPTMMPIGGSTRAM